MKKIHGWSLKTIIVFFMAIALTTSSSSILLTSQKNADLSSIKEQKTPCFTDETIDEILSMIDEALLMKYLQYLVGLGPRVTGTYGCEKAAQYIHAQFTNMGLDTRYHNWTMWGNRRHPYFYTSQNIEGTLPGTNTKDTSLIIFNAHYDSVAAGPGANDDGSGTAAVLAAAYVLSQFEFQRTLRFVTFSGEEIGLMGSRAYAKQAYERNDNILVEINADMIGHDEGGKKMTVTATEDVGWVADVFQNINTEYQIGLTVNRGTINRIQHRMSGSDFASFLPYSWESVCCWEGDHDPNFHSARDNLSNVNISYLVNTTRIIAASLAYLADITDTPPQVRITSPRVGFLYNAGMKKRAIREFKTTVINDIWIWAEAENPAVPLRYVQFFYDGKLVYNDTEPPFAWHFNKFSLRNHEITIISTDELGRNSMDWRQIRFLNIPKKIG
jgi:hypothetical protein